MQGGNTRKMQIFGHPAESMHVRADDKTEAPPLWKYVSIPDFSSPAAPVTHTAGKRLAVFRHLFQHKKTESESPLKTEEELRLLPHYILERIAPSPDWNDAADALGRELAPWLEQEKPDHPVIVLVGPPHGGHTHILSAWAQRRNFVLLAPPSPEQILAQNDDWLTPCRNLKKGGWVFPFLEKAYLRHATGLGLIRGFLDSAYAGNLGRGIIGCDSWAWAFIRHLWYGRLPVTLTLQAFDPTRLADYFHGSVDSSRSQPLLFRQSDNGHYVLYPEGNSATPVKKSNFLPLLAAYTRGNLGVAHAVWRTGLRTEPDKIMEEEKKNETGDRPIWHPTIWVTPWNQLMHPSLPAGAERNEAIVLHTLLLHNGLSFELLRQLLPQPPHQVMETLFILEESGVVVQDDTLWRVSPRGYPAVRQFLQIIGFPVDQL